MKNRLLIFMASIMAAFSVAFSAQRTHTWISSADTITVDTLIQNGQTVLNINYGGLDNQSDVGEPLVPIARMMFAVPANVRSVIVNGIEFYDSISMQLQYPLAVTEQEYFSPDVEITPATSVIPHCDITVESVHGINNIAIIDFVPVRYEDQYLVLYKKVEVTISYDEEEDGRDLRINNPEFYINSGQYQQDIAYIESNVVNPSDIDYNAYASISLQSTSGTSKSFVYSTTGAVKAYEYCIVCPSQFGEMFERMASLKRAKGLYAGVVYMENIKNDSRFRNGTLLPSNDSDAAILREFLYWAYQNGCRYAIIGGKPPLMPTFYLYSTASNYTTAPEQTYIPSDLYFANFSNDWDANGDGIGEEQTNINYGYDLMVSRLNCKNSEEIENFIHKLEFYEFNPDGGSENPLESSYFGNSFSFIANDIEEESILHDTVCVLTNRIFNNPYVLRQRLQNSSNLNGQYMTSLITSLSPSFISIDSHGSPEGFKVRSFPGGADDPYGVNALDDERHGLMDEFQNGIDCVYNFGRPAIYFVNSCTTAPFDSPSLDGNGRHYPWFNNLSMNFSESVLFGKNYGGVAYIGNTRYGWKTIGPVFLRSFLESLENYTYHNLPSFREVGEGFRYSRLSETTSLRKDHALKSFNFLGDPNLRVWTDAAQSLREAFTVEHYRDSIVIKRTSEGLTHSYPYLTVTTISPESNNIVVRSFQPYDDNIVLTQLNTSSSVYIYAPGTLPYLADIDFINCNLNSNYYYCTNAKIGVVSEGMGQVSSATINMNKLVTIDALENVELGGKFIIYNKGKLVVYCKGVCTINNPIIFPGGTLEIHCDSIIDNGVNTAYGTGVITKLPYDKYFSNTPLASSRAIDDYKPFVEAGKTWRYKLVDDYIPIPEDPEPYPEDVLIISIGQAMEIEGEEWNPVYVYQHGKMSDDTFSEPNGYVKEDVTDRKVYWKSSDKPFMMPYVAVSLPQCSLLYDFNNPNSPQISYELNSAIENKPGSMESEGVIYNGYIGYYAFVERLGFIERLDTESDGVSTIFGIAGTPMGWGIHEYRPYIYEVTDGEGNILYQRPENRPSASLSDEKADAMVVTVVKDKVSFSGAAGCPLEITNMHGMVVWRGSTDSAGRALSPSLAKGAYVAKHGTRAIKLIVK